jgi:hypothetical protein
MAKRTGSTFLVAAAALLAACTPTTDRDRYGVGDTGSVTFHNQLATTLYLGGCGHFDYEKRVSGRWVPQSPDMVCVWEGFAEPVPPGTSVVDGFVAREPGLWRLRYRVGVGCASGTPLSQCPTLRSIASNEFVVQTDEPTACVVTGCSSHVCAERHVATTCEFLPHYACYRDANCGHFGPHGSCDWEPTPELIACLEANGAPLLTPR